MQKIKNNKRLKSCKKKNKILKKTNKNKNNDDKDKCCYLYILV